MAETIPHEPYSNAAEVQPVYEEQDRMQRILKLSAEAVAIGGVLAYSLAAGWVEDHITNRSNKIAKNEE